MNPALTPQTGSAPSAHTRMPSAIRAVTFDVYSALFDTISGLRAALAALFRARGVSLDPAAAAATWRQRHMTYLLVANSLEREPATNRRALEASAQQTLHALTPPLTAAELDRLIAAWEDLPPHPEASRVLSEVRRRPLILATLSNGDRDMLANLLQHLPVAFDHIVSTEGGKFKPHPSVYAAALRILGVRREELLHVAGSATDAAGASAFGVQTVWVNRTQDTVPDPRFAPAYMMSDLTGVLDILPHA
jgi:2-haloacid dehalogenase